MPRTKGTTGTKRGKKPATKAAQTRQALRIAEAVGYAVKGYTEREIAAEMHISQPTAHRYVTEGLRQMVASVPGVAEMRAVQRARLERIAKSIMPAAEAGDVDAIDRLVKVAARHAKLDGLDAPTQQTVQHIGLEMIMRPPAHVDDEDGEE